MRRRRMPHAVVSVALTVGLLAGCAAEGPRPSPTAPADLFVRAEFAPAAPIVAAAGPETELPFAELADPDWIAETAASTGIPARALQAYAAATIVSNRENPGCAAGWNTLAGIGRIESRHGAVFDGRIEADGFARPEIFGVPLDGAGVAEIPDSDGGAIDSDAEIDRAVGPMQVIPQTWRNWHVDANGDGVESPHSIDDAALAAVHYLCRAGGDLSTEDGWRTAILAWNDSDEYLGDVGGWAVRYTRDAAS